MMIDDKQFAGHPGSSSRLSNMETKLFVVTPGSHSGAFYVLCHYFPDSKFVSARHHKLFSGQKLKNLMFNTCRKNKGILNIHMFYVLWTLKNLYKCVS